MKRLIFISILLVTFVAQAQIPVRHLPNDIPKSKLDAATQIEIGSSGTGVSNPTVRAVTTQAQLVSALTGLEKQLSIKSDITLTSNITLPNGAIINSDGGIINVNGYQVTYVNNTDNALWNYTAGSINLASTFKNMTSINVEDYGAVNDGVQATNTGTDNKNVLVNVVSEIARIAQCDIKIGFKKRGNYAYLPVAANADNSVKPSNLYVTGTSSIYIADGSKLMALTAPTEKYDLVTFWNSKNAGIYGRGAYLVGDLKTHNFALYNPSEYCHAIRVINGSEDIKVDINITEFSGDGVVSDYNPNFYHYNTVVESAFTKNYKINADGSLSADSDYAYSQRWSMASFDKDFVFGGSSFSGMFGLDSQEYAVAFYNSSSVDGNTTTGLIGYLPIVETYQKVPLPTGTTHIRLVIYTPSNWGNLIGTIYEPNSSSRITITSPSITWCMRQGFSNLPPFSVVDGVLFDYIGRNFSLVPGSPGYGGDQEDGYQNLTHITVKNSIFKNCKGGFLIWKGSRYNQVLNNKFLYETVPNWMAVKEVDFANGEYGMSTGNVYQGINIGLGRGDNFHNETLKDVTFLFTNEEEHVHDIINGENVRFGGMVDIDSSNVSRVSRSNFRYTKPLNATTNVFDKHFNTVYTDVIFDFKGHSFNNTNHKLSNPSFSGITLGGLNNVWIKDLVSESPHDEGFPMFVYKRTKDVVFDCPVKIKKGQAQTGIEDNLTITNGWLELTLSDYPSTNTGTFTTRTFNNLKIDVNDQLNILYLGRCALTANAKDVNLVFNGGSITMPSNATSGRQNQVLSLSNYGTKHFINYTFNSAVAATQALDSTYRFTNCTFNGVTFTGATIE